jgi:hypothetical protein
MNKSEKTETLFSFISVLLTTFLLAGFMAVAVAQEDTTSSEDSTEPFDGLVLVKDSVVAMAYVNPDADFSVFEQVMILDPFVGFRSNWQRDQRRSRNRISARDMERIKADVARIFREVFTERLEANDGYTVVDAADYDVLLLRPAIIDLDITAPDTMSAGRSRTAVASTGAATLYLELFDSVSGEILARAADRRTVRSGGGRMTVSNRVTNTQEARRMFGRWADILRDRLDTFYPSKDTAPADSE